MVDRIRPIKVEQPETGGTETDEDFYDANPNEDHVDTRGIVIQNNTSDDEDVILSRNSSGDMTFKDQNVSEKTLTDLLSGSGLTEEEHRDLDQLVHQLAEDYYSEYSYSFNRIINIDIWEDATKTTKIRDFSYTYTGNRINTETIKQYDESGVLIETLTYTYNYTGFRISSVTCVRS
jgi:hypothetical protein